MIREWCDQCGARFAWEGWAQCPMRCDSMKCCTSYEVPAAAEAFWTAIAHERAEADRQREAERAERTSAAMRIMTGGPVSGNELLASLKLDPTIPINTTPVFRALIKAEKDEG